MKRESLEKVREKVLDVVSNTEITTEDKVELLLNLFYFLDPEKYEENIKILRKQP